MDNCGCGSKAGYRLCGIAMGDLDLLLHELYVDLRPSSNSALLRERVPPWPAGNGKCVVKDGVFDDGHPLPQKKRQQI